MASHNTGSAFPLNIDSRMYYQDIQLSQMNTKTAFETALNNKQYTDASTILRNSDIDYYGAYLFNKSEDKLYAVQSYMVTKVKPDMMRCQPEEPNDAENGMSWIS